MIAGTISPQQNTTGTDTSSTKVIEKEESPTTPIARAIKTTTLNLTDMKKKHRRAVYNALIKVIRPVYCIFYYPATWIWKFTNWLKTKLRVYDYDPD